MVLDPDSMIPLYHQLKEILRQKVESKEWQPDDVIPSETKLAQEYDVSRATVRRAVSDLSREGLFYRKQGRGTFVRPPKINQGLMRFYSFAREMQAQGLEPSTEILYLDQREPGPKVRSQLRLTEGDLVYELKRLRLAKGDPVMVETQWLPAKLFPNLNSDLLREMPLYDAMEQIYGIHPVRAEQYFEPVLVDEYESGVLQVPQGSPALLLCRLAFDSYDRPIEFCKSVVRGDKCRYFVNLA